MVFIRSLFCVLYFTIYSIPFDEIFTPTDTTNTSTDSTTIDTTNTNISVSKSYYT